MSERYYEFSASVTVNTNERVDFFSDDFETIRRAILGEGDSRRAVVAVEVFKLRDRVGDVYEKFGNDNMLLKGLLKDLGLLS